MFPGILRILHVEDEPTQAFLAEMAFKTDGTTVELTKCASFLEALDLAQDEDAYDIVILDLFMPDAPGGVETFRRWFECCPQIPTVVFTASEEQTSALQCLAIGAQDYVLKQNHLMLPRVCHYAVERWKHQQELRQAYQDLDKLTRLYRNILDTSPDLIVRFSPNCEITYANKVTLRVLDMKEEDILGRCLLDFVDYKVDGVKRCFFQITPDHPTSNEIERKLGDHWIAWVYSGIFDSAGRLIEYQAVGRDITYKYLSMQELASELTAQVVSFNEAFTAMSEVANRNLSAADAALKALKENVHAAGIL
jgi:PAS domain S-box-containing protein